jgi:hypothetical protein
VYLYTSFLLAGLGMTSNTLIIGYPKNQAEAKDKWKEENISYNKWMEKNS